MSVTAVPEGDRRNQKEGPVFSFGAIADVQYADLDDGWNYNKTYRRYYRAALLKLKRAVDVWIRDETHRLGFRNRSSWGPRTATTVQSLSDAVRPEFAK